MKKLSLTVIALSLTAFIAFLSPSFAQTTVVVPNDLENTGTFSGISSPFSCAIGGLATSERYQQVYLGSQFPEAGLIDKISFRLVSAESPFSSPGFGPTDLSGVLIELSTTQAQPNALSNTFADNVGPDVQAVFAGVLTLSAPQCNENLPQPCTFDIMIPLQNPFFYDPGNGNLLLDVRIPECVITQFFDLATGFPSIVSLVLSLNANSDVADFNFLEGLVTQFQLSPPPPQFITLAPSSATNDAGTEHTVTATVLTNGTQDPGELVTFEVISGPNAGEMSDPNSGECTPNDDCTTDVNGQVSWTYTGNGLGKDTIIASFVDITGLAIESDPAEKLWVPPPRPIPTLSEWGLIITAGVLGIIGLMVIRRRKLRA